MHPQYIPIQEEFVLSGFSFLLLQRIGDIAVFQRTKPGWQKPHYEVMKVKKHEEYKIKDKHFPAAEYLPDAEEWGGLGFTYNSLDLALKRATIMNEAAAPTKFKTNTKTNTDRK